VHFDLRPEEALGHVEAAEEGARLLGVPVVVGFAVSTKAVVLDLLGRAAEAETAAAAAVEAFASAEPSIVTAIGGGIARTLLHARDPERLLAAVSPGDPLLARASSVLRVVVPAALSAGRADEAERWVRAAADAAGAAAAALRPRARRAGRGAAAARRRGRGRRA
jgi:hypothetical protein